MLGRIKEKRRDMQELARNPLRKQPLGKLCLKEMQFLFFFFVNYEDLPAAPAVGLILVFFFQIH
jgi:hypothetical protein